MIFANACSFIRPINLILNNMTSAKSNIRRNTKHTRRDFLKCGLRGSVTASLGSCLWLNGCNRHKTKKPNVLLIVLDTARADHFSFMGYHRNTSPNIDALAQESAVFDRAYSTCCWTLPSHGSLFTGLYPVHAGSTSETLQLPGNNTTITESLAAAGYDTAAFVCNSWISKERGFDQGFGEFNEMWRGDYKNSTTQNHSPLETTAVQNINAWISRRETGQKPFFLFANLNGIHLPYTPPEPFLAKFLSQGYTNQQVNRIAAILSWWPFLAGEISLSEKDFRIMNDLYDGEVAFADHLVGQMVNQLKISNMLDDTVIIVTSDHGENLGEHGLIDHMISMYETTLHIPLLIRYPKAFEARSRVKDLVSLVDIVPTVSDLCGISNFKSNAPAGRTSLADKQRISRSFIISGNERPLTGIALMKNQYPAFDTGKIDYKIRTIRSEPYKLIWNVDKSFELYDLDKDPGELTNLADSLPHIRTELHKMLMAWLNKIPDTADIPFLEGQDQESIKILRSLGYLK